ncbi:MAG: hypothetical protein ACYCWC_14455 [Rhodocyclaceae bacterium]
MTMRVQSLALLLLFFASSYSAHADDDIEWRHRATQGTVTLTANPLDVASRNIEARSCW